MSDYIIPILLLVITGYALLSKRHVYDDFINGAEDGIKTVFKIMPTLIGLMVAVGVLRASGLMEVIAGLIAPVTKPLGFPSELVPLVIVKAFSSSAATRLLLDIFERFGPDSFTGELASVILSCTETIFYTMAVYFMSVGIKKTRYTLAGALFTTLVGIIVSTILVSL